MTVTHINPSELHNSPYFSQGTLIEGGRILFVGGQNGTDANGDITGDIAEQSAQAMRNVLAVLKSVGATQENVAKLTVYLVGDADVNAGYAATVEVWGSQPTAITGVRVTGLARPEALVEVEAIAVLP